MGKLKETITYLPDNYQNIVKQIASIKKNYLSTEVEKELWSYTKFLSKREIRPYEDAATIEDVKALSDLVIDLQVVRERVLTIYLKMKKAKTRLEHLEKEFLTSPRLYVPYIKLKNQEQRDLFIFDKLKDLAVTKSKRKLLSDMADRIMDMLDKHASALKNNSYDLKAQVRRNRFHEGD